MTLALLGGDPVVPPDLRRFAHPRMSDEVLEAIAKQATEQISIYDNGGVYAVLEAGFRDLTYARYALSVNSGTSALLSAYHGLGITTGDEVLVPAYTFFATATPLLALGAKPILVDCDELGGVAPAALRAAITAKTRAVAVTHMWGVPCDMANILNAAEGLPVVEDASHAHGARIDGQVVGSIGAVGAWSLQGKKLVTAGEGGMLTTSNQDVFERAVLLGHFNKRAHKDVTSPALKPFATTGTGMNLRMHPLGAAIAMTQLHGLPQQLADRREVALRITTALNQIDGLRALPIPPNREPAWYAYPVFYDPAAFPGVPKERFVAALRAEGADEADIPGSTRPLIDYPVFADDRTGTGFPKARAYHDRLFKLPTWYGPRRHEYAAAYISAIEKIVSNWTALKE